MEGSNKSGKRGKFSNNGLLLAVLIGFCILAIIEIIYGQARIRMEKERLELEQANNKAVQELQTEWNDLKGEPSVGAGSAEKAGEEQSGGTPAGTEKTLVSTGDSVSADSLSENDSASGDDEKQYDMQIVFMGDSILDSDRDYAGVASLIGTECNAMVYNLAIGGTTAAVPYDESYAYDSWSSLGLLGVVNAMIGNVDVSLFDNYKTARLLRECDFSKTDYFVIEYGINDFLCAKIPRTKYLAEGEVLDLDDLHTYNGALDSAISKLVSNYPNAKVIVIGPHYCQFFSGSTFLGDSYTTDYGYGTLAEFYEGARYMAEQHRKDGEDVLFFDAMADSGINAYTADSYLEDGIHLTEAGRRQYASCLSNLILKDFYPEE